MNAKPSDELPADEIARRLERGLKRSMEMKPQKHTPLKKRRPAKANLRKAKSGRVEKV